MNPRIALIITAAGIGKRLGAGINKTLLKIEDQTILEIALSSFLRYKEIAELVISYHPQDYLAYGRILDRFCERNRIAGERIKLVEGGKERSDSVFRCLKALEDEFDFVMIHDAARPFFPQELFHRFLREMKDYEAIIPYLPSEDTTFYDSQGKAELGILLGSRDVERPDRSRLLKIQTPQCFSKRLSECILKSIENKPGTYSDESTALMEGGERLKLIRGSKYLNKMTDREDYEIFRQIYRSFLKKEALYERERNEEGASACIE